MLVCGQYIMQSGAHLEGPFADGHEDDGDCTLWMDEWLVGWLEGWLDGWMEDGWMDGRADAAADSASDASLSPCS